MFNICLTVVTCPKNLVHPANGFFRVIGGYTFGSIVTYQCNNTYAIIGQATRTCGSDGMWTDSTPTCKSEFMKSVVTHYEGP